MAVKIMLLMTMILVVFGQSWTFFIQYSTFCLFFAHSRDFLEVLLGRSLNAFLTRPRRLTHYSVAVIITVVVIHNIYHRVPWLAVTVSLHGLSLASPSFPEWWWPICFRLDCSTKNIIIDLPEDDGIKERLEKQIDFYTKSVKIPSVYRVIFIRRVHDLIARIPYMMLVYRIIIELDGSYNTPNFKMFLKRKRSEWFYRV